MATIAEGALVRLSDKVVGRVVSAKVVGDHLEVTLAIDDDLARKLIGGGGEAVSS